MKDHVVKPRHARGDSERPLIEVIVATRLQKLRVNAGLSQWQVGQLSGVHEKKISHYETGRHTPTISSLQKILHVFGLTLSHFFAKWEAKS